MFAHLFLLAGGWIFYSGGQYSGNNGSRPAIWDPGTRATTTVPGLTVPDMRNQVSVVLPPAQGQLVLVAGGGSYDMHNQAPAIADAAIANVAGHAPAYNATAPLHAARMHMPSSCRTGQCWSAAGQRRLKMPRYTTQRRAPGDLEPAPGCRGFTFSTALLMPDGRVGTAGSNPQRTQEELRIEAYWLPYLFHGPRPTCTPADVEVTYGARIGGGRAGRAGLRSVSRVRPGATTHSADNDHRLVDVPFQATGPDSVELDLPADPNMARRDGTCSSPSTLAACRHGRPGCT